MKKLIPQWIKNIYHLAMAVLANLIYGFPSRKIKVIGVTGTNGKTTTVQIIAKILEEAGKKVAVASTINFKLGKKEWVNKTKFTTLSPFSVQKFIRQAVEEKCDYLVLETSSHSLDQHRVWGVDYKTAVITNVTREHLDYHQTMEKYRQSKMKLFEIVSKYENGTAIVNLGMERPEEFLGCKAKNIFGYSLKFPNYKIQIPNKSQFPNSNFQIIAAENIELGIDHSKFRIKNLEFILHIPGEFNIENALAGIAVGISEGIDMETIRTAVRRITGVSGRLENVPNGKGLNIIVDYAVTPDSLEKLYAYISRLKKNDMKIISVFGSCGERDRGKRPIMGEIVSRYADYAIVTNEDPYNEDPWQIINEVASGIKNKTEGESFWKIFDRKEAIEKALALAKTGDIVVVTGKGAEEIMQVGKQKIPWNDKKVILQVLQEI